MIVETRFTAALREGAEVPPPSVEFTPIGGGSDAHLVGPGGDIVLNYVSPTRFRQLESSRRDQHIRRRAASPLLNRPLEILSSLEQFVAQPVMIAYSRSLGSMALWEESIHVNGRGPWYYSYKLHGEKPPDGRVPIFRMSVAGLLDHVRAE
ncbi:MAG TPA: hypothetical protein VJ691_17840 [Vicinamibacterales bacterium]|nr:hypothetical protein [Vicinamibacterales bacterium]